MALLKVGDQVRLTTDEEKAKKSVDFVFDGLEEARRSFARNNIALDSIGTIIYVYDWPNEPVYEVAFKYLGDRDLMIDIPEAFLDLVEP